MTDDRPRGILSPADRAFLRGDTDLESDQSQYDARYRIRERVRNALLDFSLLAEHLEDRDREQIFASLDGDPALAEGLVDALAVLYRGAEAYEPDPEALLSESIRRAERRRQEPDAGVVAVSVDVQRPSRERIATIVDRIEEGAYHELGEADLRALACVLHERSGDAERDALGLLDEKSE